VALILTPDPDLPSTLTTTEKLPSASETNLQTVSYENDFKAISPELFLALATAFLLCRTQSALVCRVIPA
jgi:hypothetical protein